MMVVNEPKPKEPDSEQVIKERLLGELANMPLVTIMLAYTYATNFSEIGEDVTKRWVTTQQQTDILQRAYNKGYEDAREKAEYPLGRNDWQE